MLQNHINTDFYYDRQGLDQLRAKSRENAPEALRQVAQQFESVFLKMMLKSMRDASFGDPMMDSNAVQFYRQMGDDQLALDLSKTGSLGLADMIVEQMGRYLPAAKEGVEDGKTLPVTASVSRESDNVFAQVEAARKESDKLQRKVLGARISTMLPFSNENPFDGSVGGFVDALMPHAAATAKLLGVQAEVLVAQAALETGWGKHMVRGADGRSSNNLFNIKADSRWSGESAVTETTEYYGGKAVKEQAAFRAYASMADSFKDYALFLRGNSRYGDALTKTGDARGFLNALQAAGYATDPRYAEKVLNILEREPRLQRGLQVAGSGSDKAVSDS